MLKKEIYPKTKRVSYSPELITIQKYVRMKNGKLEEHKA